MLVVKFALTERARARGPALRRAPIGELGGTPLTSIGGTELPYLRPAKILRLYIDRAVYMLKPAQYKCFSPAAGQSDGDRIVADLMNHAFPTSDAAVSV